MNKESYIINYMVTYIALYFAERDLNSLTEENLITSYTAKVKQLLSTILIKTRITKKSHVFHK